MSCHAVSPDAGQEAVLIEQPWFFGRGGVSDKPIKTGLSWEWFSTSAVYVSMIPNAYNEVLDDAFSNENTPLDFNIQITLQVEEGKSPILIKNYGADWYKNNIQSVYINQTRSLIGNYSPFDLMSNRQVIDSIDNAIKTYIQKYIDNLSIKKEFPVKVVKVVTGKAKPNAPQLNEMNKTAQYIQEKVSQERRLESERSREAAERQKAVSDKAYMTEMGLTPQQYIQLTAWNIIAQKNDANIDVLFDGGSSTKMWNVK